jgi:hypothetical protein
MAGFHYLKQVRRYESMPLQPPDFDKVPKTYDVVKDSLFNKCFWENWISACRKLKLDTHPSPCTSFNSKWIKDLDIRPETLKLAQERAGNAPKLTGI